MDFFHRIKKEAKTSKIKLFFDMDGTCVEYTPGQKEEILNNKKGLYLEKRALFCVIKKMRKFPKIKNVEVCIASLCHFPEQKEDKISWLRKFAPFVKEINILVLNELNFKKEEKDFLKANLIASKLDKSEQAYLIEDDHDIIKATNSLRLKNLQAVHISTILD